MDKGETKYVRSFLQGKLHDFLKQPTYEEFMHFTQNALALALLAQKPSLHKYYGFKDWVSVCHAPGTTGTLAREQVAKQIRRPDQWVDVYRSLYLNAHKTFASKFESFVASLIPKCEGNFVAWENAYKRVSPRHPVRQVRVLTQRLHVAASLDQLHALCCELSEVQCKVLESEDGTHLLSVEKLMDAICSKISRTEGSFDAWEKIYKSRLYSDRSESWENKLRKIAYDKLSEILYLPELSGVSEDDSLE